jgi:DNA-binding transcriptional LysR family regulator
MSVFEGVEIFVRVVEAGSFTAAAAQLGVAKSSVSTVVRKLEARLGVRLLDRTTRRLTPTEAGRAYYEHCRVAVEEAQLARAKARALHADPAGRLRVAAPEGFERLLLPGMVALINEFPGLEIEFIAAVEYLDLIKSGVDLAIRVTPRPEENLIVRKLGISRVVIVASPDYLARFGRPQEPRDVQSHRCIGFSPLFWAREWRFEGPKGPIAIPVKPIFMSNATDAMRSAARAGVGLSAAPHWLVEDELQSGALVQVLEDWKTPESGVYAVYPSNRLIAVRVRRFVDMVAARMQKYR